MTTSFPRKILLFVLLIFAIIGAVTVLKSLASSQASNSTNNKRYESAAELEEDPLGGTNEVQIPIDPAPFDRVELANLGYWNTVACWPSVGGIIVNAHISSVELDFLNLSRFESSSRSFNTSEEDEFCRQLRKTGGKWWEDGVDYMFAARNRMRRTTAKEKAGVFLGWPEDGGVWVLKTGKWHDLPPEPGVWRFMNAHTMEERCRALEMVGAIYYKSPEDCDEVKELLGGFGEHEIEEESAYTWDYPS